MKNIFFTLVILFFAFISCRDEDRIVQKIDQVMRLYIDSAGQDMLNSNIPGSYSNIQWNDVYGLNDIAPVNFSNTQDIDTVNFLEYVAGAKRIGVDSIDNQKIYESKIALNLTRIINDSTNAVTNDTMTIQYLSTPEIFHVSKVWYNNVLSFTKVDGEPNIIKIKK